MLQAIHQLHAVYLRNQGMTLSSLVFKIHELYFAEKNVLGVEPEKSPLSLSYFNENLLCELMNTLVKITENFDSDRFNGFLDMAR